MRRFVVVTVTVSIVLAAAIAGEMVSDHASCAVLTVATLGIVGVLHVRSVHHIDRANRPADEAYELGYQMGYDRGYHEGHKQARPVVVSLPRPEHCPSSTR